MAFRDFPPPGMHAEDLLMTKEHFPEFWETEFGSKKVFFVRKTTDFRSSVVRDASKVYTHIPKMQDNLRHLQSKMENGRRWGSIYFDWNADFSRNQVGDVWNRKPIAFDKAAKVILTCAQTADEERGNSLRADRSLLPSGTAIYDMLWIEPSVYFVHGFNDKVLAHIRQTDDTFLQRLKEATRQKNTTVFSEMANGETVILPIAKMVQKMVRDAFPSLEIGDLDIPPRNFRAAENQTI